MMDSQSCGCHPSRGIICPPHQGQTYTSGTDYSHTVTLDLFDYGAAADRLIAKLGWDESDRPEVIEALRHARAGIAP